MVPRRARGTKMESQRPEDQTLVLTDHSMRVRNQYNALSVGGEDTQLEFAPPREMRTGGI